MQGYACAADAHTSVRRSNGVQSGLPRTAYQRRCHVFDRAVANISSRALLGKRHAALPSPDFSEPDLDSGRQLLRNVRRMPYSGAVTVTSAAVKPYGFRRLHAYYDRYCVGLLCRHSQDG